MFGGNYWNFLFEIQFRIVVLVIFLENSKEKSCENKMWNGIAICLFSMGNVQETMRNEINEVIAWLKCVYCEKARENAKYCATRRKLNRWSHYYQNVYDSSCIIDNEISFNKQQ